MISHPEYGNIKFQSIYFALEKPILFSCYFENTPDKYVGMMVEDFEDLDCQINSYYFAGILSNELHMIENKVGKLREFFKNRPVWWMNHRIGPDTDNQRWAKHSNINPMYLPTEKTKLCYNKVL